jgi:hypothetical protein
VRMRLMTALICGGAVLCGVKVEAEERLVPSDNYSNAVSGPIMFSDAKLVFLELKQSLSLARVAHNAPIINGKQTYSADIYKVPEPRIITSYNGYPICNLHEPHKRVTYVAKWQENDATWISLFIGSQIPTDNSKDYCTTFTYNPRQ